jgi:hypothetical protein
MLVRCRKTVNAFTRFFRNRENGQQPEHHSVLWQTKMQDRMLQSTSAMIGRLILRSIRYGVSPDFMQRFCFT